MLNKAKSTFTDSNHRLEVTRCDDNAAALRRRLADTCVEVLDEIRTLLIDACVFKLFSHVLDVLLQKFWLC